MRHPHSPMDGFWRKEDPDSGEPLPGSTSQNWLAAGSFAVAGVLAGLSVAAYDVVSIFAAAYGFCLAGTAFLVRPRRDRRRTFGLLMTLILLQAAVYVLFWYPQAANAVTGREPEEATAGVKAVAQVGLAAFLTGWAPSLFLYLHARQGRPLLLVQIGAPAAGLVLYVLHYVVP